MKNICLSVLFIGFVVFAAAQGKKPTVLSTSFRKDSFFITRFGAKADGITLNTKSINDAIDACNKKGGGIVVVPAGLWLTGPIVLKSNVNLHLKRNAILQFTKDFNQYPLVEGNWEGLPHRTHYSPPVHWNNFQGPVHHHSVHTMDSLHKYS